MAEQGRREVGRRRKEKEGRKNTIRRKERWLEKGRKKEKKEKKKEGWKE